MLSRRRFLELAAISAAVPLVGCRAKTDLPNVLFFCIDDLNDWVGFLGGHPQAKTPNLDALAYRGVRFSNAHCAAPTCGGSRTAILTGLAPNRTGVYGNQQHFRATQPDCVTLSQLFAQHGYRVITGGKVYHIDDPLSKSETLTFEDRKTWDLRATDPAGYASPLYWQWGPLDADGDDMSDGQLATQASDFLMQPQEGPFFFGLGFWSTHLPWYAPAEFFRQFPADEVILPLTKKGDMRDVPRRARLLGKGLGVHRAIADSGQWPFAVSAYLATMTFLDSLIGRVLDALEQGPHRDNTIVVLWSDHGFMHGQKQHWAKFVLWEQSTRAPLIIYDPRAGANGSECDQPVVLTHLYPTLADLCGLPLAGPVDGTSLRPLIEDTNSTWDRVALTSRASAAHAVRSRNWRYIRYGGGDEELYNHQNDPLEWRNLARRRGRRIKKVKERLAKWIPTDAAPSVPQWRGKIHSD